LIIETVERIKPHKHAKTLAKLQVLAINQPILDLLQILSLYSLAYSLYFYRIIHLNKQPSKSLYSQGTNINSLQLIPKSQRSQVHNSDSLVYISGRLKYIKVEPKVEIYYRLIRIIGIISEVTSLLICEVANLVEFRDLTTIEITSWICEVIKCEVTQS